MNVLRADRRMGTPAAVFATGVVLCVLAAGCRSRAPEDPCVPASNTAFSVVLGARDVKRTNLNLLEASHGSKERPVLTWGDPAVPTKFIEYELAVAAPGDYKLSVTLATLAKQPMDVFVNGVQVLTQVGVTNTGGYDLQNQRKVLLGRVPLRAGSNLLMLHMERAPVISSITIER